MSELTPNTKGYNLLDSTVDIGWRDGPKYDYQGVMPWTRWGRVRKADAAVFHYTGPATAPAIRSAAHGAILSGVNLWRREYSNDKIAWDGCVGFKFENPASSTRLSNCSIAGFDVGILFAKSNHVEQFLIENIQTTANRVFFRNEEQQAVSHHFQNIFQDRECEVLFQFALAPGRTAGGGGNVSGDNIVMQYPGLMLDIDKTSHNSCDFTFTNVKIDGGNMKDWRLLRHKAGPLSLTVRGLIGDDVQPAKDAIETVDPGGVDVELFWKGRIWPRDFEWNGTAWQVRP